MHYRILVDSSRRMSGHAFDFDYDISGLVTARDLVGKTWMAAVEWSDPVRYSESSPMFAKDVNAPSVVFLTCPTLAANNTYESWSCSPSSTLAVMQNYCQYGYFGMTADVPYLRKSHLGLVVQGDRINQAGSLRFRVMMLSATGLAPLTAPDGVSVHGANFSFSLVFWEVKSVDPERPIPAFYDFYKVWVSSRDRQLQGGGTPAECEVPIRMSTSGSMSSGVWQYAVESFSPVKYSVATAALPGGIAVVSNTFPDANNQSRVVAHLSRSFRTQEETFYGLKLSLKPVSRDMVGHPMHQPLDNVRSIHIGLRDAASGAALSTPQLLSEWVCCFTFFRVK
jgi:hypothetical protein